MTLNNTVGGIAFIVGLISLYIAFTMDISVAVDYANGNSYGLPERVTNLGLIQQKQNYMVFGGIITLVGFLMIYLEKSTKIKK
jgi:hypothetical protein